MTREQYEMLHGATEVFDAVRDQLRFSTISLGESCEKDEAPGDSEIVAALTTILVDIHLLLSQVERHVMPYK